MVQNPKSNRWKYRRLYLESAKPFIKASHELEVTYIETPGNYVTFSD